MHDVFAEPIPSPQLTPSQQKAVDHIDGPILVLAGPGSGKTRVITSRIVAMIRAGIPAWNICAITFTNKAAGEMKERVEAYSESRGVHVSTFHSLCVRILRRYGQFAEIEANFSIYDDSDQKRCMKEAIRSCDYDTSSLTPARMLAAVSKCKNRLELPADLANDIGDYYSKALFRTYEKYQKILRANNALDFDDLLLYTALLLKNNQDVRTQLANQFQYLLVDEYQDTNHAQYQIAHGLAAPHGNIFVTGDPDQSIYRWRGADITNILAFEKDWPNAEVIKLEENFRSTPSILAMADKLISLNKNRKPKTLIPTREDTKPPEIQACPDDKTEAGHVADQIAELLQAGQNAAEIAVFYRVNSMSRSLEEAFVTRQIPYQVVRGVEFYSRKEIRDMLAYLKLMANPSDDAAFLRAVQTHPRGIGKTTLERLAAFASQYMLSLYAAAAQADKIGSISAGARTKIKAFHKIIEGLKNQYAQGSVSQLMEETFDQTGYETHLQKQSEKEEAAIENIDELINAASRYDQTAEEPSLLDYLQSIALYSDTDAYDPESGKVSLMTLHAAKGLEFEQAFIVGLEEGLLPHERSMESEEELEEERRLFFVGITRAKDRLYISYARHRVIRGQFMRTIPSKFLYEIGYSPETDDDFADSPGPLSAGNAFGSPDTAQRQQRIQELAQERGKGDGFTPGELVRHGKFGLGRIKEYLPLGDNSVVVVKFNSGKTKSLMLKYARLERMEN